jgi:hypothetical protein
MNPSRAFFVKTGIFLLVMSFLSCYTRKNACLDTLANNYDVTADDACGDCCKYPSINLLIDKIAGDSVFRVSDTLTNDLGQKFRVIDLRCYLSECLVYQKDKGIHIIEKITNNDKSLTVSDDVKIWRWADESAAFGTVKSYGVFDSLIFYVGLSNLLSNTNFTNLTSSHVLHPDSRIKDATDKLSFLSMRCVRYQQKTDTINLYLSPALLPATKISVKSSMATLKGSNITYKIKADYLSLMKGIDLRQSSAQIEKSLAENIQYFFIVK